jgi:hypothetical protein
MNEPEQTTEVAPQRLVLPAWQDYDDIAVILTDEHRSASSSDE